MITYPCQMTFSCSYIDIALCYSFTLDPAFAEFFSGHVPGIQLDFSLYYCILQAYKYPLSYSIFNSYRRKATA